MSDRSTGARAAQLVREAAGTAHGALMAQLRKLGITKNTFFAWESGETIPSLYTLQAMALHGYDVLYILIGRRGASNREYQTGGGANRDENGYQLLCCLHLLRQQYPYL